MFCFHFLCGEKIPFRNFKVTCATKKNAFGALHNPQKTVILMAINYS
jgi:hypothetical protein